MSPVLASGEVRSALGLEGPGEGRRFTSTTVDSRRVEPGALFFALEGERHDGFDFLDEVAREGARGAVVPAGRDLPGLDLEWFPVEDPREAMLELAAAVRRDADARVVGITGSSGKTTVKEMTAAVLAPRFRVHRTEGNLNSQVGLPLSVFDAPEEADVWVLELGSNAPGEIGRLTGVAAPDDAVVTTVGPAHLEAFGDLEGVLEEKLDLVRGAREGGTVVVGERPAELVRGARAVRSDVRVAGLADDADVRPDAWSVEADHVTFRRRGVEFRVEAGGEHHLRDALLALAVAEALGVEPEEAAGGLAGFRPLGLRGDLRRVGGLAVLADCYNANPESFEASVRWCVDAFPDRRRAAAVGTMLEMGERSAEAHRGVARLLVREAFDPVAATGAFVDAFSALEAGEGTGDTRVLASDDAREAGERLAGALAGDEVVLVKGSRGARMERALEELERVHASGESAGPGATAGDGAGTAGDDADRRGGAG